MSNLSFLKETERMTIYESKNSNEKERRDDFRGNSEILIEIDEIMMRMKSLYHFHPKSDVFVLLLWIRCRMMQSL